ncbi:MAG: glycosyltransferase 87 family protein [Polyangiales bacterium]
MTAPEASARVRAALFAIVACVVLNLGATPKYWAAIEPDVLAGHPRLATLPWLPFAYIYRRAADEELYFTTAQGMLGRPTDPDVIRRTRGDLPDEFKRLPPADGHLHAPYREVAIEYPPIALPFLMLPALVAASFATFAVLFGATMGALLVASAWLVARVGELNAAARLRAYGLGCAMLLAHGAISVQRLDAIVAGCLAIAFAGAVKRDARILGLGVGLAFAAKILPALVVLPLVAVDARAWSRRARLELVAIASIVGALGLLPLALAGESGWHGFFGYHGQRGLQVESTLAVLLETARWIAGHAQPATLSYGSWNVAGGVADALAKLSLPLTALAMLIVTAVVWRSDAEEHDRVEPRAERAALAMLAGCVTLWLTGKVFSPQYLTWAIPLVMVLRGPAATPIARATIASLLLAQLYLRLYYGEIIACGAVGVLTLLARAALLAFVLIAAVRALRTPAREGARARS